MRFKKISFNNYRCFLDGCIEFTEIDDKNINLLLGPIGGGKTETLFAFWWTLYDFDFSSLTAKENTPYALNSKLYQELERSEKGAEKSCSVTIEFENDNKVYLITKRCEYRKTEKGIKVDEYQVFGEYNEIGELGLPIRDRDEIDKKLSRIIPKQILYGIIFDGERMQHLNSPNEKSKNAIMGVINDITNVDLIEKCSGYFDDTKSSLNKELKQLSKKSGDTSKAKIIEDLEMNEAKLKSDVKTKNDFTSELEDIDLKLILISGQMEKNKAIREIEEKRKIERIKKSDAENRLEDYYKNFSASLKDAYLLVGENLFNTVDTMIQQYDVPKELTVPAVKNILKRPYCICHRPMDDDAIKALNELIKSLPPDNINSTISEMIRQTREKINDTKIQTNQTFELIQNCETEIKNSADSIALWGSQIDELGETDEDIIEAKMLENEYKKLSDRQVILKHELPNLEREIKETESLIKDLIQQRDAKSKYEENSGYINNQIKFIDKCLFALDRIREINKNTALDEINVKLNEAFELLSEDYAGGRRVRIIQYEDNRKYRLFVYKEDDVNKLIEDWKTNGEYKNLIDSNKNDDEIFEHAIVCCPSSNSMGQSKVNTLSFIKAILDYSNRNKDKEGIEIEKNYPLLIDAPFGDISGDSLNRSSSELHSFADQIILMLDKTRYEELRNVLDKNICKKYEFVKSKDSFSEIIPVKED